MIAKPGPSTQFGRIPYSVVDSGMLAAVKPAAVKVYMVIAAHADANWRAKVGMRRIAMLAGIELGSVSRSVGELRDLDLIDTPDVRNGQALAYQMVIPDDKKRSPAGERSSHESVHPPVNGLGTDRSPVSGPTVHSPVTNRSPVSERNRSNRVEQHACSEVILALKQAGVEGKALAELASLDGLTAADVRSVEKRAKTKATSNPAGMVVRLLRDGERATAEDRRATRQRAWDELGDDVHAELFEAVQEAEPEVAHCYGCMDTQRAMRKLARERGLLA